MEYRAISSSQNSTIAVLPAHANSSCHEDITAFQFDLNRSKHAGLKCSKGINPLLK
jgi:hypothetical protein